VTAASPDLLERLDRIADVLREAPSALALLGLGSVGRETERIDVWSDLDFFVIVQAGHVGDLLESLWWLERVRPLVWTFRNTVDGYRALMNDGVLCEFAVFEPSRLAGIPYAAGRVVWAREGFDAPIEEPTLPISGRSSDVDWIVGEALSNLMVGLQRWHRGERSAGARLVQVSAVDRLIDLLDLQAGPDVGDHVDPFVPVRRVEQRFPQVAAELADCMQGVARTRESAAAVLAAFEARTSLHPVLVARVRELLSGR
jgi:hypothetical protein